MRKHKYMIGAVFLLISGFLQGQNVCVQINDNLIDLNVKISQEKYVQYESLQRHKPIKVKYQNIPENIYETDNGYGGTFVAVDNKSDYEFNTVDTIQSLDSIRLTFIVNDKKVERVSFCFQSLSTSKRISHTKSPEMNSKEIPSYLKSIIPDENGTVIIYAIEFFDESGVMYSLDIGYNAITIK
jgi:hypothetical protein